MDIFEKINRIRMGFMRRVASHIGNSRSKGNGVLNREEVKRVLISRPNGRLGNMLLITPLVQEVEAAFPGCKIDLFVKGGIANAIFQNYEKVDRIIQLPGKPFKNLPKYVWAWTALKKYRYDLVINVVNYSSSGRLSTKLAHGRHKLFNDNVKELQERLRDYGHMAKNAVYNFRDYLLKHSLEPNKKPVAPLNLKLSPAEIAEGRKKLNEMVSNDRKAICLFTYATGSKCYSEEWWGAFYERLKAEYPEHNFVEVLPKENVSQIGFRVPTLYSGDIREIAAFIANCDIFIGADSGIMHLASASGAPVVGLFSMGNAKIYTPYGNGSTAINTQDTTPDDWIAVIDKILQRTKDPHRHDNTITGDDKSMDGYSRHSA